MSQKVNPSVVKFLLAVGVVIASTSPAGYAQSRVAHHRAWSSNVIVPQSLLARARHHGPVKITDVEVGVVILEQVATTTLDIRLHNPSSSSQTAELLVPVPQGAVVRSFTFQGSASEPTAEVLRKDQAKRTFDSIVRKLRDPALLEFAGYNLIRSSVFPVAARGKQQVRLTYENLLPADGNRVDFILPRTEAVTYDVPWNISVKIKSKKPIATVYSPSHMLETIRRGKKTVSVRIAKSSTREPGAFRLSYLLEGGDVSASLFAYPDPTVGGGYFLLLAGLPEKPSSKETKILREVTLVIDRSGSMAGEKMEQVREAALQVLEGLSDGEAFNLIVYNGSVDVFSDKPLEKTKRTMKAARKYIEDIKPRGGTNIHDALLEALRQKPTKGMLPIVLFLTDGLPTIGQTSEIAIRNLAMKGNPHHRRIFSFGVGVDVNTPLLDKIALETRGFATFVLPKEDLELKVAHVFKGLDGPVLASPELKFIRADGKTDVGRVRDLLPSKLPDLYKGDQLVLLGQYRGSKPLSFRLKGNYLGMPREFKFKFKLDGATTRNAFVPRLWASRKIARLIDAIRDMGAAGVTDQARIKGDPKLKELTDEIVRLSTQFGILTEYTAFLAKEGTDLSKQDNVLAEAKANFYNRAWSTRYGLGSYNQELNNDLQRGMICVNIGNRYWDANMNRVSITTVQQVNDLAFYNRGGRWIDSRIVTSTDKQKPAKVIHFGSPEFRQLAATLAKKNRLGSISLRGDIVMVVNGETILVKGPEEKKN